MFGMATNSLLQKGEDANNKSHERKATDVTLYYVVGLIPVIFSSYVGAIIVFVVEQILKHFSLVQIRFSVLFGVCGVVLFAFVILLFFVTPREFDAASAPTSDPVDPPTELEPDNIVSITADGEASSSYDLE